MANNNTKQKAVVKEPAQYEDFSSSVINAAMHQASLIAAKAKKESDTHYKELLAAQPLNTVAAYKTNAKTNLRRQEAADKQENRRKLLVYRMQLVHGIFAEAKESLEEFAASDKYADYLIGIAKKHAEDVKGECTVILRAEDEKYKDAILEILPKAKFETSADIKIGGMKLVVGRLMYVDTLSDALESQQQSFLTRCKLYVEYNGEGQAK
ncbi:MAG: hypothetical protein EOM30_10055 [Clostridia bacterium]|nr:hypothetical protein [Clostridia bacterium]NLS86160.1 hypothetical protein [Oscillospiraceae bacterium]